MLLEAQAHHQAGRIEEAERAYRLMLERLPAQPEALQGLGLLAYKRGHAKEAIGWLAQACAADPDNPQTCFRLAYSLDLVGEEDEAMHLYEQAVQVHWSAR